MQLVFFMVVFAYVGFTKGYTQKWLKQNQTVHRKNTAKMFISKQQTQFKCTGIDEAFDPRAKLVTVFSSPELTK